MKPKSEKSNLCEKNRYKNASWRPFWGQGSISGRFWGPGWAQLGPKIRSGTCPGRFKFFINLRRVAKTFLIGSREAAGKHTQGASRDHFWLTSVYFPKAILELKQ